MLRRSSFALVALALGGIFGSPASASRPIEPRNTRDIAGELRHIARASESTDETLKSASKQLPSKLPSLTASASFPAERGFTLREVVDACPLRLYLAPPRSTATATRSAARARSPVPTTSWPPTVPPATAALQPPEAREWTESVSTMSVHVRLSLDLRLLANPPPEKGFRLFEAAARTNESARARWYDARNAGWLSEDPLGTVDSPSLYAFVGHQPNMGTDPTGECVGSLQKSKFCQAIAEGMRWFGQGTPEAETEANEREFYLQQKVAFMQANGRRPAADDLLYTDANHRELFGSGKWVDTSGRIEADHAELAVVGVGLAGRAAFMATRAAGGTIIRAASSAAVAAADETAGNIIGFNPSTIKNVGRWVKTSTPWGRQVFAQAEGADWDFVRPAGTRMAGKTNREAAMAGYAPIRLNDQGRVETMTLHHLNKEPGGSLAEVWSTTHNRRHAADRLAAQNGIDDPLTGWRVEHPEWSAEFNNEKAVYWKWRTRQNYVPGPITVPPSIDPNLPQ